MVGREAVPFEMVPFQGWDMVTSRGIPGVHWLFWPLKCCLRQLWRIFVLGMCQNFAKNKMKRMQILAVDTRRSEGKTGWVDIIPIFWGKWSNFDKHIRVVVSNMFYFHPYLGKISDLTNKVLKPPTSFRNCVSSFWLSYEIPVGKIQPFPQWTFFWTCFFWGGAVPKFLQPSPSPKKVVWTSTVQL